MEFRQQQLENGLQVIAECNPRAYSLATGFFVNAGSRDEDTEIAGVSHFLEHMAFKGTEKRSAADVNRELDEIGSSSNARTSEELTIYHSTVLPEFQDRVLDILSDIMRPSLRDDDFESEKKVIIEEIKMYDDYPPFGGHEKVMHRFFGSHPLGQSVLGTAESVSGLTPQSMKSYFDSRYSPSNIVLAAAGNVDFDNFVKSANEYCENWKPAEAPREKPPCSPNLGFEVLQKESAAQQYFLQLCASPHATDERRYAARILSTILGDDSGSRFYWEFIDSGLAESAWVGSYEYQGFGVLYTVLCCAPEQAESNLSKLAKLQTEIQKEGVTQDELDRAKRKITAHIILQSERSENRLFNVGTNWIYRQNYLDTQEIVDKYQSVTVDEVNSILADFPLSDSYTLAVGPREKIETP